MRCGGPGLQGKRKRRRRRSRTSAVQSTASPIGKPATSSFRGLRLSLLDADCHVMLWRPGTALMGIRHLSSWSYAFFGGLSVEETATALNVSAWNHDACREGGQRLGSFAYHPGFCQRPEGFTAHWGIIMMPFRFGKNYSLSPRFPVCVPVLQEGIPVSQHDVRPLLHPSPKCTGHAGAR